MSFHELKEQISLCQDCRQKFGFTPHPIFRGTANSKIMQIGQAPSKKVHESGLPFNDPSGAKLKYQWYEITDDIFYDENNFYMTGLAHCFPGKHPKGGDNPPPLACANKWLAKEIVMVDNDLYIIIGARAAKYLFPKESFEDLVFRDSQFNGKPAIVLPHPSPLNVRWFKSHPSFEEKRVPEIREMIWDVLGL
ncbi:uracil-DNA glycosylase family protein [Paenibacillus glycanilyticus]|uniref:Uracil-DNA glycosylase n=1 Tax=Paenibacillus glycanilyticus TaxID=126569 RepID=A0ABQ6GFW4_9BACL|nr:uracil-DNA glycosylase family protein [Paenibacillus glycanilyticus]GLX69113.1 uracil-DNA glycosylase [Paenibacillus glycanilyticus]